MHLQTALGDNTTSATKQKKTSVQNELRGCSLSMRAPFPKNCFAVLTITGIHGMV